MNAPYRSKTLLFAKAQNGPLNHHFFYAVISGKVPRRAITRGHLERSEGSRERPLCYREILRCAQDDRAKKSRVKNYFRGATGSGSGAGLFPCTTFIKLSGDPLTLTVDPRPFSEFGALDPIAMALRFCASSCKVSRIA